MNYNLTHFSLHDPAHRWMEYNHFMGSINLIQTEGPDAWMVFLYGA